MDCTKILVSLQDGNYDNSTVVKIDGESMQGYKLAVLKGILNASGIAEEIAFGTLKPHDTEQCRELLRNTSCLHKNDILIDDRVFLSREKTIGAGRTAWQFINTYEPRPEIEEDNKIFPSVHMRKIS